MSERGLYMEVAALAWSLGTKIGIPLGGVIGSRTTWRWTFYINIPTCVLCIAGLVYSLQLHQDTSSFMNKLGMLDRTGLGVYLRVYSVPVFAVFIFIQWRVSSNPMMPPRIFHDRSAIVGFVTSFLHGLFLGALQHGVPHASLETMTCIAYSAPAGLVASMLVKRTQRFKYIIVVGWALLAAGMGSNVRFLFHQKNLANLLQSNVDGCGEDQITMHPDSSKAVLYGLCVLISIGGGLLFPTPLFAVQARQNGGDIGIATSVQLFMRSLGTAFGVGLGGVISQNQWTKEINRAVIAGRIPPELRPESHVAEIACQMIREFPSPVQHEYRWVYARSLTTMW
ncbi:uncharacterized protein LDX57_009644 [Aspergillus melleus]|uniref:uncharacterized protein n=1 Tax=Aspergillus melleus TaxID=138277 RepID=UPI001E8DBB05|nr:uncharacterized protein LDX57_009644 [Aspergillus melleus]KAH8431997.1 hypothetical protein LDX57_009644 [Aspergillus melleus]